MPVSDDRRMLIIGHWGPDGTKPSNARVRGLTGRLATIYDGGGRYPFKSMDGVRQEPDVLLNPSSAELYGKIVDESHAVNADTLLVVHYIGHGNLNTENEVELRLQYRRTDNQAITATVRALGDQIYDAGYRKLILILDCCHAGFVIRVVGEAFRMPAYVMLATDKNFAFNCDFSDAILSTLSRPPYKNDQRIDRPRRGFTYKRLFEGARSQFLEGRFQSAQVPQEVENELAFELILDAPAKVPEDFNGLVSKRTVYGRVFSIMKELERQPCLMTEFVTRMSMLPEFLLEHVEGGRDRTVGADRMREYRAFLLKGGLVTELNGMLSLSEVGIEALSGSFNRVILETIDTSVLPESTSLGLLEGIVNDLIRDTIPATPAMIAQRLRNSGIALKLDSSLKVAFALLPSTGKFLRSSSAALFPAEPHF